MTTFASGDRVRATECAYEAVPVGSLGTVLSLTDPSGNPYVAFDHDPDGDGSGGWAMFADQVARVRRPWRHRVWFWKPQLHWFGWQALVPVARGGDEWDWHTVVLGWTVTGRVIVALHRCPKTGRCDDGYELALDWPAATYPDDEVGA